MGGSRPMRFGQPATGRRRGLSSVAWASSPVGAVRGALPAPPPRARTPMPPGLLNDNTRPARRRWRKEAAMLILGQDLVIDYPVVDADAHVNEPPGLWQER